MKRLLKNYKIDDRNSYQIANIYQIHLKNRINNNTHKTSQVFFGSKGKLAS